MPESRRRRRRELRPPGRRCAVSLWVTDDRRVVSTVASLSSTESESSRVEVEEQNSGDGLIAPRLRNLARHLATQERRRRLSRPYWFSSAVPVLEVLIALVAPSVSTSGQVVFTTAFAVRERARTELTATPTRTRALPVGIAEIANSLWPEQHEIVERQAADQADRPRGSDGRPGE